MGAKSHSSAAFDTGVEDGFYGVATRLDAIPAPGRPAYWAGYRLGRALVDQAIRQITAAPLALAVLTPLSPAAVWSAQH